MKSSSKRESSEAGAESVAIQMDDVQSVSGLLRKTSPARACYVLAHGAGAGMRHPFLAEAALGLAERGVGTLRFQFPYMEQGSRRPDAPKVAHAAVRAAVAKAASLMPEVALFAGGKSFGGRMTSQAQAAIPLPGVVGLVFLGFPLHPPGNVSDERAQHLSQIKIPMLFLQGDHDEFADLNLLQSVIDKLGKLATLKLIPNANHSFHVPARTGRKDSEVLAEMLDVTKSWMDDVLSTTPAKRSSG